MNSDSQTCPRCGASIPLDAPQGLCASCLLKGVLSPSATTLDLSGGVTSSPAPANPATRLRYFGDYELIDEVARGGMGVVYRARQVSLNRVVAVKMILSGQLASDAEVKRFRVEAEAAANLQHPHIVAIHEIGEHEGRHYFSMDFIEGKNLLEHTLAQAGSLSARDIATLVKTLAEAVHYAHQRGTLHRDLKPQNVLIDAQGRPHITDFGLAKRWEAPAAAKAMTAGADPGPPSANGSPATPAETVGSGSSDLTRTGAIMGSPSYMAPEQAAGKLGEIGPATDVYSLGAILYQLLTGQPPHRGVTPIDTVAKVIADDPPAPRRLKPSVPVDLETVCLKCLEKRPERRYATARQFAEELGRFVDGEPILARRPSSLRKLWSWTLRRPWLIAVAAAVLLAVSASIAFNLWQNYRFERRQGLILQARELAQSMPADVTARKTPYARGMALLAEAAQLNPEPDVLRAGLELLARSDRATRRIPHTHGNGVEAVSAAVLSGDNRFLVSAFTDGYVEVFAVDSGQSVFKSSRLEFRQPRLACSPDGAWVALADAAAPAGDVQLWHWKETPVPRVLHAHASFATALAFSPDGQSLFTAGQPVPDIGPRPEVRQWNLASGVLIRTIVCSNADVTAVLQGFHARQRELNSKHRISGLAFDRAGTLLLAFLDIGSAEILRLTPGSETSTAVVDAAALRLHPGLAWRYEWFRVLSNGKSTAAVSLWDGWWSYLTYDSTQASYAWRSAWLAELRRRPMLMTPDGRFIAVRFQVTDLKAAQPVPVSMPGIPLDLASDGTWLAADPAGAAFNLWRSDEVRAEWTRVGLWPVAQTPPSRRDRLTLALQTFGFSYIVLLFGGIALALQTRMALREIHTAVARPLIVATAIAGAMGLIVGVVSVGQLVSLLAWGVLERDLFFHFSLALMLATIVWSIAAIVRAGQVYHSGLSGRKPEHFRSSPLVWLGALVGGVVLLRGFFPDATMRMRNWDATGLTPLEETRMLLSWVGLGSGLAAGGATFVAIATLWRAGRVAKGAGLSVFFIVPAVTLVPAVAWLDDNVDVIWGQFVMGFGLGALLAIVLVPRVHAQVDRINEDRYLQRLARREAKRRKKLQPAV